MCPSGHIHVEILHSHAYIVWFMSQVAHACALSYYVIAR